jgi:hypothetical protein
VLGIGWPSSAKVTSLRIICLSLSVLVVVPAAAFGAPNLTELGAFVYGRALFVRVIGPQGYAVHGSQGSGSHQESEVLGFSTTCTIPEAPTETCTLHYENLIATYPLPPGTFLTGERFASCAQTIRIRDLGRPGALAKAREDQEFIGGEPGLAIPYSYHGYAVVCEGEGLRTVYAGDPEVTPAPAPTAVRAFGGMVAKGGKILLKVDVATSQLVHLSFQFPYHCRDGLTNKFAISALSTTDTESITNGAFTVGLTGGPDTFSKSNEAVVKGAINGTDAKGTMEGILRSRHHGLCKSGRLRWSATLH